MRLRLPVWSTLTLLRPEDTHNEVLRLLRNAGTVGWKRRFEVLGCLDRDGTLLLRVIRDGGLQERHLELRMILDQSGPESWCCNQLSVEVSKVFLQVLFVDPVPDTVGNRVQIPRFQSDSEHPIIAASFQTDWVPLKPNNA